MNGFAADILVPSFEKSRYRLRLLSPDPTRLRVVHDAFGNAPRFFATLSLFVAETLRVHDARRTLKAQPLRIRLVRRRRPGRVAPEIHDVIM